MECTLIIRWILKSWDSRNMRFPYPGGRESYLIRFFILLWDKFPCLLFHRVLGAAVLDSAISSGLPNLSSMDVVKYSLFENSTIFKAWLLVIKSLGTPRFFLRLKHQIFFVHTLIFVLFCFRNTISSKIY